MANFGDYTPAIARRVIPSSVAMPKGPIQGPITRPELPRDHGADSAALRALLETLPYRMINELRKQTSVRPRSEKPFVAAGLTTTLTATGSAGARQVIASFQMGEKDGGFLTHVALAAMAPGSMASIRWSLAINNAVNPNFYNVRFQENLYSPPIPLEVEVASGRTVQLIGENISAASIDVYGNLYGWSEFLGDNNRWGNTQENGIG